MALYDYHCSECKQNAELSKRIADRDAVEADPCPSCGVVGKLSRLVSSPLIGYSTTIQGSYGTKVPEGFKDLLQKMHKNVAGSQLNHTSSFGDF
jgi:putative FmdB family regulatory protein